MFLKDKQGERVEEKIEIKQRQTHEKDRGIRIRVSAHVAIVTGDRRALQIQQHQPNADAACRCTGMKSTENADGGHRFYGNKDDTAMRHKSGDVRERSANSFTVTLVVAFESKGSLPEHRIESAVSHIYS